MRGHHEIFSTKGASLYWRNDPTGKRPDHRPFYYTAETGWVFRLFVRELLTESSGQSALVTVLTGLSMVKDPIVDLTALEERLKTTMAGARRGWNIALDSLRHAGGIEKFDHGVIVKSRFPVRVPMIQGTFNHGFLSPWGEKLEKFTCGCMERIAFRTERDTSEQKIVWNIKEIMCEHPTDALLMAYVLEAHSIEFELY